MDGVFDEHERGRGEQQRKRAEEEGLPNRERVPELGRRQHQDRPMPQVPGVREPADHLERPARERLGRSEAVMRFPRSATPRHRPRGGARPCRERWSCRRIGSPTNRSRAGRPNRARLPIVARVDVPRVRRSRSVRPVRAPTRASGARRTPMVATSASTRGTAGTTRRRSLRGRSSRPRSRSAEYVGAASRHRA